MSALMNAINNTPGTFDARWNDVNDNLDVIHTDMSRIFEWIYWHSDIGVSQNYLRTIIMLGWLEISAATAHLYLQEQGILNLLSSDAVAYALHHTLVNDIGARSHRLNRPLVQHGSTVTGSLEFNDIYTHYCALTRLIELDLGHDTVITYTRFIRMVGFAGASVAAAERRLEELGVHLLPIAHQPLHRDLMNKIKARAARLDILHPEDRLGTNAGQPTYAGPNAHGNVPTLSADQGRLQLNGEVMGTYYMPNGNFTYTARPLQRTQPSYNHAAANPMPRYNPAAHNPMPQNNHTTPNQHPDSNDQMAQDQHATQNNNINPGMNNQASTNHNQQPATKAINPDSHIDSGDGDNEEGNEGHDNNDESNDGEENDGEDMDEEDNDEEQPIKMDPTHSDGNLSLGPKNGSRTNRVRASTDEVARYVHNVVNSCEKWKGKRIENPALPDGYTLWKKERPVEEGKTSGRTSDKYLYGHPSTDHFTSAVTFSVHFLHLLQNAGSNVGCTCVLCANGKKAT